MGFLVDTSRFLKIGLPLASSRWEDSHWETPISTHYRCIKHICNPQISTIGNSLDISDINHPQTSPLINGNFRIRLIGGTLVPYMAIFSGQEIPWNLGFRYGTSNQAVPERAISWSFCSCLGFLNKVRIGRATMKNWYLTRRSWYSHMLYVICQHLP